MALTFYYASGSPYAWRVWLALERKGARRVQCRQARRAVVQDHYQAAVLGPDDVRHTAVGVGDSFASQAISVKFIDVRFEFGDEAVGSAGKEVVRIVERNAQRRSRFFDMQGVGVLRREDDDLAAIGHRQRPVLGCRDIDRLLQDACAKRRKWLAG